MARHDLARALFKFSWLWLPGRRAVNDEALLESCADLFSGHYGTWGTTGRRPGEPVQITPEHVRRLLDSDDAYIVCAHHGPILAGYAVILRFEAADGRRVAWIAQLVVHSTYRQSRVATTLMFSAWQFSDFDVWGIITANPFAIRALETATRRPCRTKEILELGRVVLADLRKHMDYLPEDVDVVQGTPRPSVDTRFPVELGELEKMKRDAARGDRPWNLGSIAEGHEWFAATFSSQDATVARGEYLDELLEGVDSIWIRAYEGMTLGADHVWHRHGPDEVRWVIERTSLPAGARVLDAGAGDGRHAVEFAQRDFSVAAVDISPRLVERAAERFAAEGVRVELVQADLRLTGALPRGPFDIVVCLYDVVGSSADPTDDLLILTNLRQQVEVGAFLVMSVMSSAGTVAALPDEHRPESEEAFVAALERLQPSRQMEQSGSVFDPGYIVLYENRFYRKEQFDVADDLPPSELIIRDRRFTEAEVAYLLKSAGFDVVEVVGVRAGSWDKPLSPNDPAARELLVVARAM